MKQNFKVKTFHTDMTKKYDGVAYFETFNEMRNFVNKVMWGFDMKQIVVWYKIKTKWELIHTFDCKFK